MSDHSTTPDLSSSQSRSSSPSAGAPRRRGSSLTHRGALSSPPVLRTFALSLVARLPLTVIGVLILLRARDLGFSYALAGVTAGAFALGMACGSPLLGRLVDRWGQSTVLITSCIVSGAAISALAVTPGRFPLVLIGFSALVGAAQPPVSACIRVLWTRTLSQRDRDAMFSADVSVQGLAYIVGPMTMLWIASAAGTPVALHATSLLLVAATTTFALDPVTRSPRGATRSHTRSGPAAIAHPGVRTIVGTTMALGVAFGAVEVGVVAAAEHHSDDISLVALLSCWAVGSALGGPLGSLRRPTTSQVRHARLLAVTVAVFAAALALPLPAWWLMVNLVVFGAVMTPLLSLLYVMIAGTAPADVLTEAYSWEVAGMTGGIAIGTSIGGIAINVAGVSGAFGLSTTAIIAGAVVLGVRAGSLNGGVAVAPGHRSTRSARLTHDQEDMT